MKKILSIFFWAIAVSMTSMAQSGYYYGFCDKDLARTDIQSLTAKKANVNFYCLIHLSADDATLLAGNKITHLYFSLGYCSASSVKIIISETPDGEALYSQTGTVTMLKWNDVELTTPYTIEADKGVYIGYEVAEKYSFDAPVDVVKDNTFGNTEGDIIGQGTSRSTATWSHSSENGYGNLCLLALIEGENLPTRNIALTSIGLDGGKGYVKTSEPFAITGNYKNLGLTTATSFTATCSIDGGETITKDYTCSVAHNDTASFSFPDLSVATEGEHTATVTITKVNGLDDQSTADNTLSFSFNAYDNVVNRKTLVEMFTSQTCKNCDAGDAAVAAAIKDNPNAILVAHHSGYAKDIFTYDTDEKYTWFFPSSGTFNPGVMFDRTNINEVTLQTDDAPVVFPYTNRCKDYLAYAQKQPTFIALSVSADYTGSNELTIKVSNSCEDQEKYTSDDLRMNIWLVEDSLVAAQTLSDGTIDYNFIHNGVIRQDVLSEPWGKAFIRNSIMEMTTTMPATVKNPQNCRLVVFITRYDASDNNKCQVLNATQCSLPVTSAISTVAPNPHPSSLHLYNLAGQRVNNNAKGLVIVNGKKYIY